MNRKIETKDETKWTSERNQVLRFYSILLVCFDAGTGTNFIWKSMLSIFFVSYFLFPLIPFYFQLHYWLSQIYSTKFFQITSEDIFQEVNRKCTIDFHAKKLSRSWMFLQLFWWINIRMHMSYDLKNSVVLYRYVDCSKSEHFYNWIFFKWQMSIVFTFGKSVYLSTNLTLMFQNPIVWKEAFS